MKTKQYAALAIIAVVAGAFLAFNSPAQSAAGKSQAFKLEGAWIARVVGMPMQWAYTVSPDPSGRRASLVGSVHVPIPPQVIGPAFPDWEYNTDMVGELVMTGPDTVEFTVVWYGMKKRGVPFDEVVLIGVNSGQGRFTGPGKMEGTHHLARIFHGRFKIRSEAEPATPKRVKRNAVKLDRDQAWARMSIEGRISLLAYRLLRRRRCRCRFLDSVEFRGQPVGMTSARRRR